jgi:hypothetical protein
MPLRFGVIGPSAQDDFAYNIADGLGSLGIAPVLLRSVHVTASGHSAVAKLAND